MYKDYFLKKEICNICNNEYDYFLNKKNVQGIGLGYDKSKGKCITVFVSKKFNLNNIPKKDMVPPYYKCIPTNIIESGEFSICGLTEKVRPTLCGYSVGPIGFNCAGTLGCLAFNKREKSVYLLGSNHVLTQLERARFGTPIVQPGTIDGGDFRSDVIGNLIRYVPIKYIGYFCSPVNYVDAAIAKISDVSQTSRTLAIINKDFKKISTPHLCEKVFKIGRTTGYTEGNVISINATQIINFPGKKALFKDQIICDIQSEEGDSGSILINESMNPLGLLLGNSSKKNHAVFNDIKKVTSLLDIEILSGCNFYNKKL